jgi:hypothetical protein
MPRPGLPTHWLVAIRSRCDGLFDMVGRESSVWPCSPLHGGTRHPTGRSAPVMLNIQRIDISPDVEKSSVWTLA